MKVGIMQPYFFPYVGYWQLVGAVDTFVILDDVNYRKGGWINRNRIPINGKPAYVTVPLRSASPNRLINEHLLSPEGNWVTKLHKSIVGAYSRAPAFSEVMPIIESLIQPENDRLDQYLRRSICSISEALGLTTRFVPSSSVYDNQELRGQDRVLDICVTERADSYLNLPGGRALYSAEVFASKGIQLFFVETGDITYDQSSPDFLPGMSIIDVLMHNGLGGTRQLLNEYSLHQ